MRRIGLLGGMSWESSAEYYRLVNEETRARLGGLHSADCILRSVDFAEIEELQDAGAWTDAGRRLAAEAATLTGAGAELLLLCTNTMHKVADAITSAVDAPLLHIADATADAVQSTGLSTIGLLGTAYTMEQDFYVGRLRARHGLNVLVPAAQDRRRVHGIIYDELCLGITDDSSRRVFVRVMIESSLAVQRLAYSLERATRRCPSSIRRVYMPSVPWTSLSTRTRCRPAPAHDPQPASLRSRCRACLTVRV